MSSSERVIRHYFEMQGVQYGFLLLYSPDFNPVDNSVLNLEKYCLKKKILAIFNICLKFAILQALMEILLNVIRQFYQQTGYLNV